jgi:hypothetical protein
MLEPAQCSRQNLILELPGGSTITGAQMMQNAQAKQNNAEVDLPSQGMAFRFSECHECIADQATEQLLVLEIAQAHSTEVALEELKHTQVWRHCVLRILLLPEHRCFVRRKQLDLGLQRIQVAIKYVRFPKLERKGQEVEESHTQR